MIAMQQERWKDYEQVMREKAYRTLDNDPQILLEHDGGPYGVKADLIFARLIGFEDEIVRDGMRLSRIEDRLLVPITRSMRSLLEDDSLDFARHARYELQSGYATVRAAAEFAPPDVAVGPPDFTFTVLYLRYRRRS